MLAKLTSKNQVTLPKAELDKIEATEYFDVKAVGGTLVLTPCEIHSPQAVRGKLQDLGITEGDLSDAIAWARNQ